jgi:Ca2+-binding RTX toxin-like protein
MTDVSMVSGGDGGDKITGSAGDNTLMGDDGNDTLHGGGGGDTMGGGSGNDVLKGDDGGDGIAGDDGNDKLYGGDGDDTIAGGPGNDTLFGDDGFDAFWFSLDQFADNGKDTIKDFERGLDKIVIWDPDSLVDDLNPLAVSYTGNNTVIDLNASLAGAGKVIVSGVELHETDFEIVSDDMPLL